MPYLTPNSLPADTICRVLFIPDSLDWLAQVTGALQELTFPYNWEQFGDVTVDEAVQAMLTMFDAFCFNQGVCRVVGEIIMFAGSTSTDDRWLYCDGNSLSRSDYPELFAVIGTTYGAADGTHFNLPDLRNRVPMGTGTNTLGTTLGEAAHTLTSAEIPSHFHTEGNAVLVAGVIGEIPAVVAAPSTSITGSTGGGGAHNNIQPSLALNYYICAKT